MVKITVRVRVSVSVSCAFSEAFVGIAAVRIAACTRFVKVRVRIPRLVLQFSGNRPYPMSL